MPELLVDMYTDAPDDKEFKVFSTYGARDYIFPQPEDRIHVATIYKMCRRGQIGHFHQGNHFKFYKKHLDDFKANRFGTKKFECFICDEEKGRYAHA